MKLHIARLALFGTSAGLLFACSSVVTNDFPDTGDGGTAVSPDAADAGNQDTGVADSGNADSSVQTKSLGSLVSTGDVTLADKTPFACGSADASDHLCGVFRATVKPTQDPEGKSGVVNQIAEQKVLIVVRAKDESALARSRWVMLDAGGFGGSYGAQFGGVPPGHFVKGGKYGDDFVRALNDDGYVTADVVYHCPTSGTDAPCAGQPYAGWADDTSGAQANKGQAAWFKGTGGTGYLGISARSAALLSWAYENAGKRSLCVHAQSSGSGRLAGAMTRYGSEKIVSSIIFSGGPVFAYVPWMCQTDGGTWGKRPEFYSTSQDGALAALTHDCARSKQATCEVRDCRDKKYSAGMLDDSFAPGADLTWPSVNVGIVYGGKDDSAAWQHLKVWLPGYNGQAGIVGKTLTVKQGMCANDQATWAPGSPFGSRSCTDWSGANFSGIKKGTSADSYDARLKAVPHEVPETAEGTEVLRDLTRTLCPVTP